MARFQRINDVARREADLLTAALDHAAAVGYRNVTREALAQRCNVSAGTISRYFGSMDQLRGRIMRAAVAKGHVDIIAQGLAAGDPLACAAPQELKAAAIAQLATR